ncbi:hypothetical protein EHS25_007587 [Saitozyma podzolica]|uniref:WSC domain-containing protein n=1 Tax=Saitozyma podzolica TaxID=1890683 RepID=A0A427YQ61_9TREE|nr:hypothetical protein EHS25_007587 [Saitozyma podzolica]
MSSLIPALLVLGSLGLASASTAAAVPIGCWSGMFTPSNVVASDSNIDYQTNADCQQYCAGNSAGNGGPIPYSYFSQSGSTVTCSCAETEGNPNWSSTTPNTNLFCNSGEWSLSITQSTEVFQGCLTPQSVSAYAADPTYVDKGYFSQVEACFGQCRDYANVFVDPANDSVYGCACSNEVISSDKRNVPTDQCSGYNRMVYSHTPGDYVPGRVASSVKRRTNRERLRRSITARKAKAKAKAKAACPEGLTACDVGTIGGDAF